MKTRKATSDEFKDRISKLEHKLKDVVEENERLKKNIERRKRK